MALSIKTEEADRLARQLAALTGETMTEAVTRSLRERLERLNEERASKGDYGARLRAVAAEIAKDYDFSRPITKQEWDEACGDTPEELGLINSHDRR
jgi:antitoxin VapB